MPFRPLRLLVLYDDARGHCVRVVPAMKTLLEQRGFVVDTHRVADGPIDVSPYRGLVIGTPVFGAGVRGVGPTDALTAFVEALPDLDDKKVALFCVYELRPGTTFDRMKALIYDKGGDVVVTWGYWLLRPDRGAHILPAECMVRIR